MPQNPILTGYIDRLMSEKSRDSLFNQLAKRMALPTDATPERLSVWKFLQELKTLSPTYPQTPTGERVYSNLQTDQLAKTHSLQPRDKILK